MITMFALAAVMLVLGAVLGATKALAKSERPEPCCTDGLDPVAAAPIRPGNADTRAGSTTPTCMVGSWAASREKMNAREFWTNVSSTLTATGTHTYEMRPDGTMTETFKNWAATGRAYGSTIKVLMTGTVEYTWKAQGTQFQIMEQTAEDLTITWIQGSRKIDTQHLTDTGTLNSMRTLACQGKTMAESYEPKHTATWTRTSSYGVYQ
jgi:hypothetical protein